MSGDRVVDNTGWLAIGLPSNPDIDLGHGFLEEGYVSYPAGAIELSDGGRVVSDQYWWFFDETKDITMEFDVQNQSTGYCVLGGIMKEQPLGTFIPLFAIASNTDGLTEKKWRLILGEDQYVEADMVGDHNSRFTVKATWFAATSTAKLYVNGTEVAETPATPGALDYYYKNYFYIFGYPTTWYRVRVYNELVLIEQN